MARPIKAAETVEIDEQHPRLLGQHGFDLKAHDAIINRLTAEQARRHHSFIFSGPRGVGKATTAYRLAEHLFSRSIEAGLFGDTATVDNNASDIRLVRAASHPDLITVEPDHSKATAAITVDQIRAIIPFLAHTPSRGGWRMVIIDAIDDMNVNGLNAMLKTLEEPPEKAMIVIISHGGRPILPTIRSRTQFVRFEPLSFDDARQVISRNFTDADPNWVDQAAVLADGAPGKAKLLAESGVVELYIETCTAISGGAMTSKDIDLLSSQWGAGGVKNTARRQLARLMMDRLLTRAARNGMRKDTADTPNLDAEEAAVARLVDVHPAHEIADLHGQVLADLDYAERVNLDAVHVMYTALERIAA
jgi:DNA polymerase-3 subunit delta'